MSTPFLLGFAETLVGRLLRDQHLEVLPGAQQRLVAEIAATLATAKNQSLVSVVAAVLERSEHVDEFYADNDTLRDLITDLGPG